MTKEIIKSYTIDKPSEVVAMATVLKNHIIKHNLYTTIVGKNYAHVEGWQFAGGMMGLFPKVSEVTDLSDGAKKKWLAKVEIVDRKTDKVVSVGVALCSNEESKKKSFDEYAVLSMAQTRAIGKAYRNLLGWVMKLAGYEGTPSEEMVKVDSHPDIKNATTGQMEGNEGAMRCDHCPEGNFITEAEAKYSMRFFKKRLCRPCQAKLKIKK